MKTNRTLLLVTLLIVLCGHEAQAFYNASTGRWLSRDPIGEEAFKRNVSMREFSAATLSALPNARVFENQESLPYVFVGNDPLNSIDLLGLCEPQRKCGRAVDQALRLTQIDVLSRFAKLGFWGKVSACAPIWLPTPGYALAWDMQTMTTGWGVTMPCGNEPTCNQTVTVGGKCYHAWDVNYLLYGWAGKLCGMNVTQVQEHVIAWKSLNLDFERMPGALAFATLGWMNSYSPLPPEVPPFGYPSCAACSLAYPMDLNSVWP